MRLHFALDRASAFQNAPFSPTRAKTSRFSSIADGIMKSRVYEWFARLLVKALCALGVRWSLVQIQCPDHWQYKGPVNSRPLRFSGIQFGLVGGELNRVGCAHRARAVGQGGRFGRRRSTHSIPECSQFNRARWQIRRAMP
jgi:hypothetical protein